MSNLKRDIEGVLDILLRDILRSRGSSPLKGLSIRETATTQIINLIESVIGKDEDLPEDVLSVGFDEWQERRTRNQFRADIKSKLIGKE